MKPTTHRGLDNAIKLLLGAPEMDRVRLFIIADGSQKAGETEEIIRMVCDDIRAHLVEHAKLVAEAKRGY